MNKDKVIKDLKERNNSLNNQFRLRDIRVNCLEHQNIEKDKEIKRLNNIINEITEIAKGYIEEPSYNDEQVDINLIMNKFLEILEKEKKE